MEDLSPDDLAVLESNPNLQKIERPSNNVGYLGFNLKKEPFNDPKVRLALSHAVNKQGIIDAFFAGQAVPAVNPIPPSMWGYNDSIQDYEYDLNKANQLLAEAGYPDGLLANTSSMRCRCLARICRTAERLPRSSRRILRRLG